MDFLKELSLTAMNPGSASGTKWLHAHTGNLLLTLSPVDGNKIAAIQTTTKAEYEEIVTKASDASRRWRHIPAPKRGEIVRQIGQVLRDYKAPLALLISSEMGKPLQESMGEVQEMIDMADFAVGQSRMLHGLTMPSERPMHRLLEQYHPLGVVTVITAFNFPMAVWAWNALLGAICGNVIIWKPSSKTPLCAIAIHKLVAKVLTANGLDDAIFSLVTGSGAEIGEHLIGDPRLPLISFTGSTTKGRQVAATVAGRLGRTILELGGNNAIILTGHADLSLAIPAVVFGAVGTSGQRCTSTRRLIVHEDIYRQVRQALVTAYASLKIGSPLHSGNHMGPLIDRQAVTAHYKNIDLALFQGAKLLAGGQHLSRTSQDYASGCYVTPTLLEANSEMAILQKESFSPILYLLPYQGDVAVAIALQNDVLQGLSSAIFTTNVLEAESFLDVAGSDSGIANVNIGTSGAEIGGAFGGEKETGGGREAGSDSWKGYMRRQTITVNYGNSLPLSQGVKFTLAGDL